jgi:hypothetical protein
VIERMLTRHSVRSRFAESGRLHDSARVPETGSARRNFREVPKCVADGDLRQMGNDLPFSP